MSDVVTRRLVNGCILNNSAVHSNGKMAYFNIFYINYQIYIELNFGEFHWIIRIVFESNVMHMVLPSQRLNII